MNSNQASAPTSSQASATTSGAATPAREGRHELDQLSKKHNFNVKYEFRSSGRLHEATHECRVLIDDEVRVDQWFSSPKKAGAKEAAALATLLRLEEELE